MNPATEDTAILHCIVDPLCGWCYAAAPLVEAARAVPGLRVALHGGGMMTGANRRAITPEWRAHVLPHDRRIAELTGQPFGEAYFDGLLRDGTAVMDSTPPTTAILAADSLQKDGALDMAHRLQQAHYAEGRRIADIEVLIELATGLGFDAEAFAAAFERLSGKPTARHIEASRALLSRVGGQGFPTFVLALPDGGSARIDVGPWLGRVDDWKANLASLSVPPAARGALAAACGPDGCAL